MAVNGDAGTQVSFELGMGYNGQLEDLERIQKSKLLYRLHNHWDHGKAPASLAKLRLLPETSTGRWDNISFHSGLLTLITALLLHVTSTPYLIKQLQFEIFQHGRSYKQKALLTSK